MFTRVCPERTLQTPGQKETAHRQPKQDIKEIKYKQNRGKRRSESLERDRLASCLCHSFGGASRRAPSPVPCGSSLKHFKALFDIVRGNDWHFGCIFKCAIWQLTDRCDLQIPLRLLSMGQTLRILADGFIKLNHLEGDDHFHFNDDHQHHNHFDDDGEDHHFHQDHYQSIPDLAEWPPELSLYVLKNLNATDLCLAACVWTELAKDGVLWHSLCCSQWGYLSFYFKPKPNNFSYHKLYLTLDEASVTFNADCQLGMEYFFKYNLLNNDPDEIAKFFYRAKPLDRTQMRYYLKGRPDILESLINLQDFGNQSLPKALRQFFTILEAPNKQDQYLHLMVEKFSKRFAKCNPNGMRNHTPETIYILCFSLIMLSVDLSNPHIKNKMSKREFIRNTRRAIHVMDDELYGHLYDDIYLCGHIASKRSK